MWNILTFKCVFVGLLVHKHHDWYDCTLYPYAYVEYFKWDLYFIIYSVWIVNTYFSFNCWLFVLAVTRGGSNIIERCFTNKIKWTSKLIVMEKSKMFIRKIIFNTVCQIDNMMFIKLKHIPPIPLLLYNILFCYKYKS